jgi:hypothetical protein
MTCQIKLLNVEKKLITVRFKIWWAKMSYIAHFSFGVSCFKLHVAANLIDSAVYECEMDLA